MSVIYTERTRLTMCRIIHWNVTLMSSFRIAKEICVRLIGLCLHMTFTKKKKTTTHFPTNINSSQIVSNKVPPIIHLFICARLQITYHTIQSICIQWTKIHASMRTITTTITAIAKATTKNHLQFIIWDGGIWGNKKKKFKHQLLLSSTFIQCRHRTFTTPWIYPLEI